MNCLSVILLVFISISQLSYGSEKSNHFQQLGLAISAANYEALDDSERINVLKVFSGKLKAFDPILYNDLFKRLSSLESINENTIEFLKKEACDVSGTKKPVDRLVTPAQYKCANLKKNAQMKYSMLKSEINRYLLPLLAELKQHVNSRPAGASATKSFHLAINDLEKRIESFEGIEELYEKGDFKKAQIKIESLAQLMKD